MSTTLKPFDITGRVALVTGATKGMGRAIAELLAQAGARVVISSRKQADAEKVAAEISPVKGQVLGFASDAGDAESLKALVEFTRKNAGRPTSSSSTPPARASQPRWRKHHPRSSTA